MTLAKAIASSTKSMNSWAGLFRIPMRSREWLTPSGVFMRT